MRTRMSQAAFALGLIHTHTFSHSDPLKPRLTHAQTHHAPIRSITDWLTLRLVHTQTHSHSDALPLTLTHTQNPLRYQTCDWLALILAHCGNVSSERFALAQRRSLTDIHKEMCQENEMHIWGAPRRVIGGPRRRNLTSHTHLPLPPPTSHTSPSSSSSLITQTHSALRVTHHTYSLITQTHSSLRLSDHSDSLITQTQ